MKQISRRTFLVQTGTVASLYPMIGILDGYTTNEIESKLLECGIQINQENGLNLSMYFFNLKFSGNHLVPITEGEGSYIVVQIPPQSLHEEFFIQPDPKNPTPPDTQRKAKLSGHSFLAFELWPEKYRKQGKKRKIRYRTAELMDWKNKEYFRLLSTLDQLKSFQNFNTPENNLDVNQLNNAIIAPVAEKTLIEIDHYQEIIKKLFGNDNLHHLTIFELPAGLLIAPHKTKENITIEITQNDYQIADQTFWVYPKNQASIKRRVLERGNLEMRFIEEINNNPKKPPISIPPTLRAIGILSSLLFQKRPPSDPCACLTLGMPNDKYLPSFLDVGELIFLNQQCNIGEQFDIKTKGPFLLGSSGATLKFSYNNHNLDGIDSSISLVEYEHHFQDGRDNFIKVARIGVIAPTSQKALHVKIAERKEIDGICFVDYKEFVEIIETDKEFPLPSNTPKIGIKYVGPGPSGSSLPHYENQIHFSRITTRFKRTPPIKVVNPCLNHFWVYTESAQLLPGQTELQNTDLMQLEFDYYDKNEKKTNKAVKHPIFFMRRDFFCSTDMPTVLQTKMASFDDGVKLRMALQHQLIAFTPDDPTVKAGDTKTANKINQLAAEYSDYYFTIAEPIAGVPNIFDKADYVIYPQISRVKLYIDHHQQYSQSPLPSLIKYNKAYLTYFFDMDGNGAKVILEQSPDFINGQIKNFVGVPNPSLTSTTALNDGYKRIIEVFNEAGDRTGGMINPGIRNKLIAFGEEGLTYPEDINEQWKPANPLSKDASIDKVLKAIDIFSTDAEIVGISLIDILGEISNAGGTPGFAADKLLAQIDNFKNQIDELFTSKIVLEAINKVDEINKMIIKLKNDYETAKATLKEAADHLNIYKNDFLALVPDVNKIKTAAKLAFEKERLNAFNKWNEELNVDFQAVRDKAIQTARDEVVREIYNLRPDFAGFKTYIHDNSDKLEDDLKDLMDQLPKEQAELKARLALIDTNFFVAIDNAVGKFTYVDVDGNLIPQLKKISNGSLNVMIGMDFNAYFSTVSGSEGIMVLKDQYQELLVRYTEGKNVIAELKACKAQLVTIEENFSKSLYEKVKTILICYHEIIIKITDEAKKTKAEQFFAILRLLNKASISYYVDQYLELNRGFDDLKRTTASELKELFENVKKFATEKAIDRMALMNNYISVLIKQDPTLQELKDAWKPIETIENELIEKIEKQITDIIENKNYFGAAEIAKEINRLQSNFEGHIIFVREQLKKYEAQLVNQAKDIVGQIEQEMQRKLIDETDIGEIRKIKAEFDRIKKILTTPKKEEFKYHWETGNFKTANLGILQFNPQSNPATKLKADVKTVVHIDPLKFPNVVDKIETYAENSLTNFSLTFLSALTVDFAHLNFVTGSSVKTKMNVSIRDVKFDGALSFVQKLEELMGGLGDGFSISIKPNSVGIGYTSPVFSISTPGFTFSNISISVILQIFFDRRPMELTFMLAKPEAKATIAAGIYGGGFYCALTAQPKNGLKSIEMALEMGALLGIRLGPIKGEVRFMIGLFYKKDDTSVIMEGYFIAEGVLSVWIISVSARLYMYVRSENSYVTGGCKATYSAKLGFVKKSFSGSYSKKLAGAESKRKEKEEEKKLLLDLTNKFYTDNEDIFDLSFIEDDYQPMTKKEWKKIRQTFY